MLESRTLIDVAIIGAGPYGLSLAANLRAASVEYRIFGRPMDAWRDHMPEGMLLKSDGFASNLFDPDGQFPLSRYCRDQAVPYDDERVPVELKTFVDYGLAFKDRFVQHLEERLVVSLSQTGDGYALRLDDGEVCRARRVVVAVGIGQFRFVPTTLSKLPPRYLSHGYDHHDLSSFAGRRVLVVGGGASAIDLAALLNERGCQTQLVCRQDALKFGSPPGTREPSRWQRLRHPRSGLGPGIRSRFCTEAPVLFHFLPETFRLEFVRRHLGPAASWHMRKRFARVPALCGYDLVGAAANGDRVDLSLQRSDNNRTVVSVNHVIAATGYRVDIQRLDFLDAALFAQVKCVNNSPILSSRFECSVKGLFFVGPAAANSFGPLMRFAFGARFASLRLTRALGRGRRSKSTSPRNHGASNNEARLTSPQ